MLLGRMQNTSIGQQIAQKRQERGLSVRQLAQICGVDYSNIGKIERGTYNASVAVIKKIADALGCELILQDESDN